MRVPDPGLRPRKTRPVTGPFLDPSAMTWTCMVCGDERPDAAISVAKRDLSNDGQIVPGATFNLRYCNDRADCTEKATRPEPYVLGSLRRQN